VERSTGIFVGAVLVLAGFFFGWFGVDAEGFRLSVSGWEIAKVVREYGLWYLLLYLLPVGALAAAVVAVYNRPRGAMIAAGTGGAFLLWAVIEVAKLLWRTTFIGLWLTVAGAIVLLVGGLAAMSPKKS
jgi:hypothetical protein